MATISISTELGVISKYTELLKESMGSSSVYIRTKETLQELFDNSNMKGTDRAKVLSDVLSTLNSSLVNVSMSTALEWAAREKELAFKKLELEKQLDILDNEDALKEAQADKVYWDSVATQAETRRMFGVPTVVDGVVTQLDSTGKVYTDMQLVEANTTNAGKEGDLLENRLKESYAAVHKIVADTVTNYGAWNYGVNDITATGFALAPSRNEAANVEPLSDIQRDIAKEQAKGYAYNAWANALTGSASLVGTAYAAGVDSSILSTYTTNWTSMINRMGSITHPYE